MREGLPAALNVHELRVFLVLAEELHFGRTADRLYLSQPQVSRSLASLERRIGARLVERTSRKVRLTPLGVSLRAELEPRYADLVAVVERARASATGLSGELSVGCTATSAGFALSRLVERFERSHPECRVVLRELPLTHPYDALRDGAVEVLVHWLIDAEDGLVCGPPLETQARVLAIRLGHPLVAQRTVSVEVLADHGVPTWAGISAPWSLERALIPATTPAGRPVERRGPKCHTLSEALDVVARSDLVHPTVVAVAEANAHRKDLAFLPIRDLEPLRLGPIWLASRENARVRSFVGSV